MKDPIGTIELWRLALSFLPALLALAVLWKWTSEGWPSLYAMARMLVQLLAIGYVLAYIFETDRPSVVALVLSLMLVIASWISLRPMQAKSRANYLIALGSISLAGLTTLLLITQGVLAVDPWYNPAKVIPLAGMIFAGAMDCVSLAAERMEAELGRGIALVEARGTALRAALIPITNRLLAVGLVSLPGMMTGQILSGVDPLVAVRYQIMVMSMMFGSAGLAGCFYLGLTSRWLLEPPMPARRGDAV